MKEIPLSQGLVALVDDEDFALVSGARWHAARRDKRFYAARHDNPSTRSVLMHRLVMNAPAGLEVDHRNGDGLDNRRANLRICNRAQNNVNYVRTRRAGKTSVFRGVSWHRGGSKWMAQIRGLTHAAREIQYIYLGLFDDEADAAHAYDRAALLHHGEFAVTNFPKETYVQSI